MNDEKKEEFTTYSLMVIGSKNHWECAKTVDGKFDGIMDGHELLDVLYRFLQLVTPSELYKTKTSLNLSLILPKNTPEQKSEP